MGSSEPVVSVGAFQSNPGGGCDAADRDESCFLSATIEGFIDQGRQAISVMNQEHPEPHAFSSNIKCNFDFPPAIFPFYAMPLPKTDKFKIWMKGGWGSWVSPGFHEPPAGAREPCVPSSFLKHPVLGKFV